MVFNCQLFDALLTTQALGRPLHWFEQVTSTNTQLWALLQQGAVPGTAVIAAQQQAGRGQWGRCWSSPIGGLYVSVAIAPSISADCTPHLTLCTAWGIAEELRAWGLPVVLKWPNDLLLEGRKLGGILTETSLQAGQVTQAVIGIGINWQNQVPESAIAIQTYFDAHNSMNPKSQRARQHHGPMTSLEQLAALTLKGVETGLHRWQADGLEAILPHYLKLVSAWPVAQPEIPLSPDFTLVLKQLT